MKLVLLIAWLGYFATPGCAQDPASSHPAPGTATQHVGGECEGCEAIFESPVALGDLKWTDTLPGFSEPGPKMLISGIIYKADGKTPAKDVVLYIYHTDQEGKYVNKNNDTGWGRRHGYIRGWMKTTEKGQYRFYTLKPASYPNTRAVKHIHPVIKEPGMNEYWIDEFVFDDDPFLTPAIRKEHQQRGGDGVIKLKNENGMLVGERNIYLGKNIPGYPKYALIGKQVCAIPRISHPVG
jgi:protocatechuate 3,4-dioxygenase beta subunit